jgi:hypothetical protein
VEYASLIVRVSLVYGHYGLPLPQKVRRSIEGGRRCRRRRLTLACRRSVPTAPTHADGDGTAARPIRQDVLWAFGAQTASTCCRQQVLPFTTRETLDRF